MEPDWQSANRLHKEAQTLAGQAARSVRDGDVHISRLLYRRAGELERSAFELIPHDKPRTLGIIAISAVALLYKSASYQDARLLAISFLADGDLPEFCHEDIKEILKYVRSRW